MMSITYSFLLFLLTPWLVLRYEKKFRLIEWLSPVVVCYAVGILAGNLAFALPVGLSQKVSEVSIMLALPMLLLATDFIAWLKLARATLISFVVLISSVMTVSLLAGLFFKGFDPDVWKMSGMMVGVYTGGTANLTAIGKMLEVEDEAFIALNAIDVVLGGIYLLFIMSFGVKILARILLPFDHALVPEGEGELLHWRKLSLKGKILNSGILILGTLFFLALSLLISKLITGGESAGVIILVLTILALGLSFFPRVRNFKGSQEVGNYFLLVFCVAVGSLADINQLISGKLWYFFFCGSIMLGSILLHFLCCFLLKIDRDTAVITSMAGIFGPAFVAPMSQVLRNKNILVSGVTTGLVGIALGNFVGLLVAYILK